MDRLELLSHGVRVTSWMSKLLRSSGRSTERGSHQAGLSYINTWFGKKNKIICMKYIFKYLFS